LDNKV